MIGLTVVSKVLKGANRSLYHLLRYAYEAGLFKRLGNTAINGFVAYMVFRVLRRLHDNANLVRRVWRVLNSQVLTALTTVYSRDTLCKAREVIWDYTTHGSPTPGHSHPNAQLIRLQAIDTMVGFAASIDKPVYAFSTSVRENNRGWMGDRLVYTAADLQQGYQNDPMPKDCVLAMTDVDYYTQPRDTDWYVKPTMCYTIIPDTVAGSTLDSIYYIDDAGVYHEHVSGGATYAHHVWSYGKDLYMAEHLFSSTLFHVHIVKGPSNRAIVFRIPAYTTWVPPFILRWFIDYSTLSRVSVSSTRNGCVMLTTVNDGVVRVSIRSPSASGECVRLTLGTYEAARHAARITTVPGVAGLMSLTERCGEKISVPEAYILLRALEYPTDPTDPVNYTKSDSVDPGTAFAALAAVPLVPPASAATSHDDNFNAAVEERVTNVRNTVVPDKIIKDFAVEFNSLLYPDDLPKLVPLSREEAILRLAKTTPKFKRYLANEHRLTTLSLPTIRAFCKKEVVDGSKEGAKPSRLIFPIEIENLIAVTMFDAPIKDYQHTRALEGAHFSCVGMNPDQLGNAVMKFANSVVDIDCTDFSKMDGRHSKFTNQQYVFNVRRHYAAEHHDAINVAYGNQRNRRVRIPKEGDGKAKTFNSQEMNLSGTADTTSRNVYSNGLVDYIAQRKAGHMPADAFSRIGPKFGDDGLADARCDIVASGASLGWVIKPDVRKRGSPITFLSRVYVAPLHTPTSVAEPVRALSRIPVVIGKDNPRKMLGNKVAGYLTTDANVPVIGQYCRALARVYKLDVSGKTAWGDERFRLELGPYPHDPHFQCECETVVATQLGLGVEDIKRLCDVLDKAKTAQDLVAARLMAPTGHPDGVLPVLDVVPVA